MVDSKFRRFVYKFIAGVDNNFYGVLGECALWACALASGIVIMTLFITVLLVGQELWLLNMRKSSHTNEAMWSINCIDEIETNCVINKRRFLAITIILRCNANSFDSLERVFLGLITLVSCIRNSSSSFIQYSKERHISSKIACWIRLWEPFVIT